MKPYKRIVTALFSIMMLFCFLGVKEVQAQEQEENEK